MRKIDLSRLAENSCWPLILTTALLMAAGLVNLYSTSGSGEAEFASPSFLKQMAFSLAGLFGLTLFFLFDYRNLKSLAWPLFLLCLILLVLVKYFGLHAGGATRWLPLGPLRFQPSELTKIGLVLVLAHLLSRHQEARGLDFQDLLWPLPLIAVPFFLILKQPDLGTALHLLATVTPMFFFARPRARVLITILALIVGSLTWIFAFGGKDFLLRHEIIKPYHLARIRYHFTPEDSPTGQGWQIIQAKSAIGSGQILGQGFQAGTQQKFGFLPAPETDFAYAALAEEWGFVGASLILVLFLVLIWSALNVVKHSGEIFGAYLALGLISLVFWQMTINLAMVVGLFPVVGIPLPFISYGGSSLLINLIAIAIIANIGLNRYVFQDEAVKHNPQVWEKGVTPPQESKTPPVRHLPPPNPNEPEPYPVYRLTRRQPWVKFLRHQRDRDFFPRDRAN